MTSSHKIKVEVLKYQSHDETLWGCEVWETFYQEDTLVKLRPNFALIEDMQAWSEAQGGGFLSFNLFGFTDQEAATLFVLRWHEA
jgi:hypothetical protein